MENRIHEELIIKEEENGEEECESSASKKEGKIFIKQPTWNKFKCYCNLKEQREITLKRQLVYDQGL